jgi:hypothetical protein
MPFARFVRKIVLFENLCAVLATHERRAGGLLSVLNCNDATIRSTNGCIRSALATIEIDKPDSHTYNLTRSAPRSLAPEWSVPYGHGFFAT